MNVTSTRNPPLSFRRQFGKWDAAYLESIQLRQPFARHLRERGHTAREINSATRQLPRIKKRLDSLLSDDQKWREEKMLLLRDLRRDAFERLRTRKTKSVGDDLRLLELIDRLLNHPDQQHEDPDAPQPAMTIHGISV